MFTYPLGHPRPWLAYDYWFGASGAPSFLHPCFVFRSVSSSPGGRVTSFLRGEWTKEGLGGTGNQGLPIYSITDFEREGAGQDPPSDLSSLSPPTVERSQRKLLFQRMSGREGTMNERSRYSRELNQCFWRGEEWSSGIHFKKPPVWGEIKQKGVC